MPQPGGAEPPETDLAELTARRDALRQTASLPGAEPKPVLDAAFEELDTAIDLARAALARSAEPQDPAAEAGRAERRMLRLVFTEAPVSLFLLERDGTVRRVNKRAGSLMGSPPAYAAGKPFTVFVDLRSRAAVQTHLVAAARTGKARHVECSLLADEGTVPVRLTVQPISLPDDSGVLLVMAVPGTLGATSAAVTQTAQSRAAAGEPAPGQPPARPAAAGAGRGSPPAIVQTMTARMDLLTAVTRLLLENSTFSETLTLQRCARLLAGDFASWVIVDVVRSHRLRRQFAAGPPGEEAERLARMARGTDPEPGSVPWQVYESAKPVLQARPEDARILGAGPDGVPLLMKLAAASVLSVPISDGEHVYGVVTLCRRADEGQFQLADLGLAEELGAQLAVAIRVDRLFRRRSEVAEALQASLLPRVLPEIPGVELAAAYLGATEGMDVGGDFYDVYPVPGGWGLAIGDVCGKGEEAAGVTASARHAIRVLAHWEPDPAQVLKKANEIILAAQDGGRFVTAKAACLSWRGKSLHASLGTAGHPGPAVIRSDGRVEILGGGGLPLGIFGEAMPEAGEVDLAEGDVLFFYTDGLTETRSPAMAYFGDRLADELVGLAGRSAGQVVTAIQARVEAFANGEMRDDLTLLALRVTGPPPDAGPGPGAGPSHSS